MISERGLGFGVWLVRFCEGLDCLDYLGGGFLW